MSSTVATAIEHLDHLASRLLDLPSIPYILRRVTIKGWNRVKRILLERLGKAEGQDGFLIEAIHHGDQPIHIGLSILSGGDQQRKFEQAIPLVPGFNRVLVPRTDICRMIPLGRHMRVLIEPLGTDDLDLSLMTADFVRGLLPELSSRPTAVTPASSAMPSAPQTSPPTTARPKLKCVVWDLDNTL